MKIALFLLTPLILFFVAGVLLSLASREGVALGLLEGRLHPCPETPNCVCSEYPGTPAYVEPLSFKGDADEAWDRAKNVVIRMGGELSRVEGGYLAATFQTPMFRFIDDVELHLDRQMGVIHMRSASRVGRSDMGVNRKRMAAFRQLFKETGSTK